MASMCAGMSWILALKSICTPRTGTGEKSVYVSESVSSWIQHSCLFCSLSIFRNVVTVRNQHRDEFKMEPGSVVVSTLLQFYIFIPLIYMKNMFSFDSFVEYCFLLKWKYMKISLMSMCDASQFPQSLINFFYLYNSCTSFMLPSNDNTMQFHLDVHT